MAATPLYLVVITSTNRKGRTSAVDVDLIMGIRAVRNAVREAIADGDGAFVYEFNEDGSVGALVDV